VEFIVSKKRFACRLKYIKSNSITGVSAISSAWSKLVSFMQAVKKRQANTIKIDGDRTLFINGDSLQIVNGLCYGNITTNDF
jgi:hypothetical protein